MNGIVQLYSTVTLRQGEKKHYNNKVDVYSFGIVLWELLTNRMPFEGMSNLQAAYAAAFKVHMNFWAAFLLSSSNFFVFVFIFNLNFIVIILVMSPFFQTNTEYNLF